MAQLHIINPMGAGKHVFKGMFGTIVPESQSNSKPNQPWKFQPDNAIVRCSSSMQALLNSSGIDVNPNEVTTIEASDDVIAAIKVTLARGLQEQWNRGYAQVMGGLDERSSMAEDGDHAATLAAIPGLGQISASMLRQAVAAEREVANRGIEQFVASVPNVAPHWMDVALKDVYVSPGENGTSTHGFAHGIDALPVTLAPVPMAGWADNDHVSYSQTKQIAEGAPVRNGYFDATAAIPVYLPVHQGGLLSQAARVYNRVFSFGQGTQRAQENVAQAPAALGASVEKAQEVMDIIMNTPVLRQMIVESPSQVVVDFNSLTESTTERHDRSDDDWDYGAEGDGDDHEDGDGDGDRHVEQPRPRG